MPPLTICRLLILAATLLASGAQAQTAAAVPDGVLHLSTSATREVANDVLTVVFTTTREGKDAQAVQSELKQALDVALKEARRVAQPDQVEVQTGNFSLYPRYANAPDKSGQPSINGWQGSVELQVQGQDSAAIAQLTARIRTLSIARVGYSLSRAARERVEVDLVAQAIAQWRARAAQMSRQFGYDRYSVREVTVGNNESPPPVQPMLMRSARAEAMTDESLPTQAGKAEVSVTVSGSAQMMR